MSKKHYLNQHFRADEANHRKREITWVGKRNKIREGFPSPYRDADDDLLQQSINRAIEELNKLKPKKRGWAFLGEEPTCPTGPDYKKARLARLEQKTKGLDDIVQESAALFNGMPHWNHPLTMPNVIPPSNIASITAAFMCNVFNPNLIGGEYSWNVEFSELETTAMISRLIGWNPERSGGLFTYGGSGCYLYALKYALTQVLGPKSRETGIRTDGKILVSKRGHYCKQNSSDWTGLGMNNVIEIETDPMTNALDPNHLERVLQELNHEKTPVISIVCTMGSTDSFAVDPIEEVRKLIEQYPNPTGYGKPLLYCDAVIGWSWLTFKDYDFRKNPLEFSPVVLSMIQKNYKAIKGMIHADAIGCDFHKVGWSPYNCSIFMIKENEHFKKLMLRPGSNYLQERTDYNPGLYTIEVSRSGSYSMTAWATLKYLGAEGFQTMLGSILEVREYLTFQMKQEKSLICVNEADSGFVSLFRVYPKGMDAERQYRLERTNPKYKKELEFHNKLQEKVADKLWQWFREKREFEIDGETLYAPYISYTSGFRSPEYDHDKRKGPGSIYALKSYPMNLNISDQSMRTLVKLVLKARDEVLKF